MSYFAKTILAFMATGSALCAQDAVPLSLQDAVAMALQRNLSLRIQAFEPAIAREGVTVQSAAFDTQLTAEAGAGRVEDASSGVTSSSGSASVGVTKLIGTGATLGLSTSTSHGDALTPDDSASLTASIRQPLLRGAWADVTLAQLRKADSQLAEEQLRLRGQALDLALNVCSLYWDLSYSVREVELLQSSVDAAAKLVEETEARLRAGLSSDIDLLQARASLSERREALSQAQLAVSAAGDSLAQAMGVLLDQGGTSFAPNVDALPANDGQIEAFVSLWPTIMSEDLDSLMQEEAIRRADLDLVVARNNRLPQLDMILEAGLIGEGDDERSANRSLRERDGSEWETSLSFSMPIGRREDVALARQAQSRLEQEKLRLLSLRQDLYKEARQAWRDVQLGIERCASADSRVEFQRMALDRAQARYSNNLISFRELLEARQDYDDACLLQIDARRDLAIARSTMARLCGNLMDILGMGASDLPSGE
jgi:outer membrane protein TolC